MNTLAPTASSNLTSEFASPHSSAKLLQLRLQRCLSPALPSPLEGSCLTPALQVLLRELVPGCGEAGAAHTQGQDWVTRHVQGKLKMTPKSRLLPQEIQKKCHCLLTDCINMILKMLLYLNMNLKPPRRS